MSNFSVKANASFPKKAKANASKSLRRWNGDVGYEMRQTKNKVQ